MNISEKPMHWHNSSWTGSQICTVHTLAIQLQQTCLCGLSMTPTQLRALKLVQIKNVLSFGALFVYFSQPSLVLTLQLPRKFI